MSGEHMLLISRYVKSCVIDYQLSFPSCATKIRKNNKLIFRFGIEPKHSLPDLVLYILLVFVLLSDDHESVKINVNVFIPCQAKKKAYSSILVSTVETGSTLSRKSPLRTFIS